MDPSGRSVFLRAEWRKLIMAQYAVAPAALAPWLPRGVELDLYQGQCFVSLVGFVFDKVRVLGIPFPLHTRFDEVNLRFYVRRPDADGTVRRGVVFIREYVPLPAITLVANGLYEEPYQTLRMGHTLRELPDGRQHIEYGWKHISRWHTMTVEAGRERREIAPGSVEEFITEHYWGFTKRRSGKTSQYEVQHPRWQMYDILRQQIDADFGALYGDAFAAVDASRPDNILLAEGSVVSVRQGSTL